MALYEKITDFFKCVKNLIECSCSYLSKLGFQLREDHLNWIEIWRVCWQVKTNTLRLVRLL
jgi:hypothetical protein